MGTYGTDPLACMTLLEHDVLSKRPGLETTFAAKGLRNVEVVVVRKLLVSSFLTEALDERMVLGTATDRCGKCTKDRMVRTSA